MKNRIMDASRGWLAALVFSGMAFEAAAATLSWNGGVAGSWQDGAGGWLNGGSPALWDSSIPDAAVFSGGAPLSLSVDAGGVVAESLSFTSGDYVVGGSGAITLGSGSVNVTAGLSPVVSASLAGVNGLVKNGDGLLVLTNAGKNYSGATVIEAGAIQVYALGGGFLGATATQQVQLSGGRLQAQFAANTTPSNSIVVGLSGGEIRNLGSDSQRWIINGSRISGSGPLTLSFGASNSRYQFVTGQTAFNGKWILDSGGSQNRFYDIFASSAFGGASGSDAITLVNNASISLRGGVVLGSVTQGVTLGVGQSRIIVVGGATAAVAAAISGPTSNAIQFATENAGSLLIISNTASTWLGETTINGPGIVRLGQSGVIPDVGRNLVINGGATLDLNDQDETIPGLFGGGTVDLLGSGNSILTTGTNNENPTFSGSIRDSGPGATVDVRKVGSGIQTLSGTNTYEGLTIVEGGILLLSGQGSIANSYRIEVLEGATLSANTRTDGSFTVGSAQVLTGSGTVRGNVTNLGSIVTGYDGVGSLIVSGQFAQAASGSISFTLAGGLPTALQVTGPASLNGSLNVDLEGAEPVSGTVVTVLTTSARSGAFATTNLASLSSGLGWEVAYTASSVVLSVTGAAPVSGFAAWTADITNGLTNYNDSATGDGYPNLLKYATGSSATNSDNLARLGGMVSGGALTLVFNRNTNATDVTIVVEASSSLANNAVWTGITTNTAGSWNPPLAVETGSGSPVQVSVTDPVGGNQRTMRLRVTIP